jgi:hypothetical protein
MRVLNKTYNKLIKKECAKTNRALELVRYIQELSRDDKRRTIDSIAYADLWDMLQYIRSEGAPIPESTPSRYVYMACPVDALVSLNVYITAAHPFGIYMTSHNNMKIGNLVNVFGNVVFGGSITETMCKCWDALNFIAQGVDHNLLRGAWYASWDAWNIRILKIDTHKHKMFISENFHLTSTMTLAPLSTYFTRRAAQSVIRDVVFGLLM